MGREARANVRRMTDGEGSPKGRPAPSEFRVALIDPDTVRDALTTQPLVRIAFRSGAYVMDRRGVLRRLPPSPPPAVLTYGPSTEIAHE